jgi:hypothetical protein
MDIGVVARGPVVLGQRVDQVAICAMAKELGRGDVPCLRRTRIDIIKGSVHLVRLFRIVVVYLSLALEAP